MTSAKGNRFIILLLVNLMVTVICLGQSWAPEWRKLTPLKSTRIEVEKILGKPEQSFDSYAIYKNANGRFSVWYSLGGCEHKIEGRQWNVPRGLMTSLSVFVNESRPFTRYVPNVADFRRVEMPYNRIVYVSSDESLVSTTIKPSNQNEFVYAIDLDPTKEQEKLLCK